MATKKSATRVSKESSTNTDKKPFVKMTDKEAKDINKTVIAPPPKNRRVLSGKDPKFAAIFAGTPGTFPAVTVDAKNRVTVANQSLPADTPGTFSGRLGDPKTLSYIVEYCAFNNGLRQTNKPSTESLQESKNTEFVSQRVSINEHVESFKGEFFDKHFRSFIKCKSKRLNELAERLGHLNSITKFFTPSPLKLDYYSTNGNRYLEIEKDFNEVCLWKSNGFQDDLADIKNNVDKLLDEIQGLKAFDFSSEDIERECCKILFSGSRPKMEFSFLRYSETSKSKESSLGWACMFLSVFEQFKPVVGSLAPVFNPGILPYNLSAKDRFIKDLEYRANWLSLFIFRVKKEREFVFVEFGNVKAYVENLTKEYRDDHAKIIDQTWSKKAKTNP